MNLRPSNWFIEKNIPQFQKWRIGRERTRDMDRVSNYIYIGDIVDAENSESLQENDIDEVVTLTACTLENTDVHKPLKDDYNDQREFNAAVNSLIKLTENGNKVLVHCAAGVSRSAAVTLALLAERSSENLEYCLNKLKTGNVSFKGRPNVQINNNLVENIEKYLESK